MLNAITMEVSISGKPAKKYWVSANTILQLADWTVEDARRTQPLPLGDGTQGKPWQMSGNLGQWLLLASDLKKHTQQERYFWISGRFIKKFSGQQAYYMGDAGGGPPKTSYDPAKLWSPAWTRTGNNPNNPALGTAFERGGPSYRNIAKRLDALRGTDDDVIWSKEKANLLRKVLLSEISYAKNIASAKHMTAEQTLPTIAAAMFLGEPARNQRAFLVNKMILDMMESGTTYGGRKQGATPKNYTMAKTFFRDAPRPADPGDKGGKMPAAMTGSGDAAKHGYSPDPIKLATWQYTQAKEVTTICRAMTTGTFTGTDETKFSKADHSQLMAVKKMTDFKSLDFKSDTDVLGYLKYLMGSYLHSFNL